MFKNVILLPSGTNLCILHCFFFLFLFYFFLLLRAVYFDVEKHFLYFHFFRLCVLLGMGVSYDNHASINFQKGSRSLSWTCVSLEFVKLLMRDSSFHFVSLIGNILYYIRFFQQWWWRGSVGNRRHIYRLVENSAFEADALDACGIADWKS